MGNPDDTPVREPVVLTLTDDRALNPSLVGGKAANLAMIARLPAIEVPPALVITTAAYGAFLSDHPEISRTISELDDLTDERLIGDHAERIRQGIGIAGIPHALAEAIRGAYRTLCSWLGPDGVRVSVRSSATAEDGETSSFTGQYDTYLNQRNAADVLASVRRVWASTFSVNPVSYRRARRLRHGATGMAVILQKMVDARAAGTAFTVDLETGAPMIRIHAGYGLGEAEVRGSVTPEVWIVDPANLAIVRRTPGGKQERFPYDLRLRQTEQRPTADDERPCFVLRCSEARSLARLVRCIGEHYRKCRNAEYVDVEYAIDGDGKIMVLQARPETAWSKKVCRLVAVDMSRAGDRPRLFMGGCTASPGIAVGTLRVAGSLDEAEQKIRPGDILAVANTTNLWERVLGLCSGAITEIGGPGSHTAIVMREQGKAAVTGAPRATAVLKDYDNTPVTLDATQRLLFRGTVPEEWFFSPRHLRPAYGTFDTETEEESWNEAARTGQTRIGADGRRWIGKPVHRVSRFMQEVYLACHNWIGIRLSAPVRAEIRDGIHWVDFHDLWQWRLRIRVMTLEELEAFHRERLATAQAYLEACAGFAPTPEALSRWLRLFMRMNAFMAVAYHIYKVTEGWLEHELAGKQTPEPYYSQVRPSIGALAGETEVARELRDYRALLELARRDALLLPALHSASESRELSAIWRSAPAFHERLLKHASLYKVVRNTDIARPIEESVLQLTARLERDISHNREVSATGTTAAEFYPEDERFVRIARLTIESEKARQDAHHINYRGHWPVREGLKPLAGWLVERGEISCFADLFDHPPDWLLCQATRYAGAG